MLPTQNVYFGTYLIEHKLVIIQITKYYLIILLLIIISLPPDLLDFCT